MAASFPATIGGRRQSEFNPTISASNRKLCGKVPTPSRSDFRLNLPFLRSSKFWQPNVECLSIAAAPEGQGAKGWTPARNRAGQPLVGPVAMGKGCVFSKVSPGIRAKPQRAALADRNLKSESSAYRQDARAFTALRFVLSHGPVQDRDSRGSRAASRRRFLAAGHSEKCLECCVAFSAS